MANNVDESRRNFLKASGLGAIAVAVAGTGIGRLLTGINDTEEDDDSRAQDSREGEIVEGRPL